MWWRKAARRWNSGLENREVGLGTCRKEQERPYGKSAAILKTGKGWMLLFCFCLTSVVNGCGNDDAMEDGYNVSHVMEDEYNADHAMESGYGSHANVNHAAQDEYSGSHTAGDGAKRRRLEEIKAAAKSYQDIYGKAAAENTLGLRVFGRGGLCNEECPPLEWRSTRGWIYKPLPGIRMEIFGERLLVFSGERSGRL